MFRTVLAATAAATLASQASAFEFKGGDFSLMYENYDVPFIGISIDGTAASGRVDFGFTPNFGTQINLTYGQLDAGGTSVDRVIFGLHPYYDFGNGTQVGAFLQRSTLSVDGAPGDIDVDYYGIEGKIMPTDRFSVQGYIGAGQVSGLGTDLDSQTIGMEVAYSFTPQFAGRFAADFDKIDQFGTTLQIDSYTLGLDYTFDMSVPVKVSLEYGSMSFVTTSIDRAALKVTIPFGGQNNSAPLFNDRGVLGRFAPTF